MNTDYGGKLPHQTMSICPKCGRVVQARVLAERGKVIIEKNCPKHGRQKELYWDSSAEYEKFMVLGAPEKRVERTNVGRAVGNDGSSCPMDCGLCAGHKSHTALANITLTNRCDLSCWYCFYYAKENDPVYEPSLALIDRMLLNLKAQTPVAPNAIQLTGGEPTLREDIVEIAEMCRKRGFEHIQLNTTGIHIAFKKGLAERAARAGVNTLYMSFDGTTPKTNPKNHWEAPYTMEKCRETGMGIVLVPTIIRGTNDHDIGNMIRFGLSNLDVIRSVNFQPVSLVGRMPRKELEKQRITIPGAIQKIEEQTNGAIAKSDFYPVPFVHPITRFVEAMTCQPQYELGSHFACGAATYVFTDGNRVVPVTRFVDVEGLFEYMNESADELEKGKNKVVVGGKMLLKIGKFVDKNKQPAGLNLTSLLFNALVKHDYDALGKLHERSMLIGMMHFMDQYNYDVERVQRCCIHYALPDGRIVPFCTFNVLPEIYRDKAQEQYSESWREWSARNKKPINQKYKRDAKALASGNAYKKAYSSMKEFW